MQRHMFGLSPGSALGIVVAAGLALIATGAPAATPARYPTPGKPNIVEYKFTAATTGEITAYFAGTTAAYVENLGLMINGVATGITGLVNQKSSYGDALVLGKAEAGDNLVFFTEVFTTGDVYFTQADLNRDGVNHAWSTSFAGDKYIPAGTYVAFEDMRGGGDFNYHDETFVFDNVSVVPAAVPEPANWLMMIAGFGMVGFVRRHRWHKTAD
jgi:hypothetical protein